MKQISHFLYKMFIDNGMSESSASYLNMLALLLAMLIVVFLVDFLLRKFFLTAVGRLAEKSKSNFDDLLVSNKALRNVAHIIPLLLALEMIPYVFYDFEIVERIVEKGLQVFGIILTLWVARSILNTIKDYLKTLPKFKDKPIDSFIQVFMIFAWVAGFMFAFAIITDTAVWAFLTAFGAASAVLILVFKDTILGFVASIQVSINDMVRIGDWITFEKFGADGGVIEINLATVKVQNFDNTITTIPTYALISDSFKNWRGMTDSEGRRIKRALIVKQGSIKFLTDTDIDNLKKIDLISEYLETRQNDINEYNKENAVNKDVVVNGRNLTNVGVFRKYMEAYTQNHSGINKDMMIMARQLPPTSQGIPLEIYAFSSDKRWENYEYIMADIFDHFLAAVPLFGLELFELPNNSSFKNLTVD